MQRSIFPSAVNLEGKGRGIKDFLMAPKLSLKRQAEINQQIVEERAWATAQRKERVWYLGN